jgi:enamine deaminase RidA (YjgF/YER057c/UK114 family)
MTATPATPETALFREAVNPSTLYDSVQFGFSHAVLHRGGDVLQLAGQVAWDADCQLVGAGDLALQTRQALANLRAVLAAVGATPANIVRLRTYVVNHAPDKLGPVLGEIAQFYGDVIPAPNTFLGVQALALPDFLVEIEATAVIPRRDG